MTKKESQINMIHINIEYGNTHKTQMQDKLYNCPKDTRFKLLKFVLQKKKQ